MHRAPQSFKLFLSVPMTMFVICYIMVMTIRMRNRMGMGSKIF